MSKKRKMERMSFLDASKSDLIDRIIWLRTNQGKEPNEEDLKGLDEEALIRLLVVLEENGLGGLTTMSLDTNFPWRNQKLLEFYNRKQMETEHEGKYLENIKKMAIEAGFKESSKLFESYVTNRFLDGIHDSELKGRILAVNTNPSMTDLENICNTSGFDLLLRLNVQHVWEKIFLSLDYDSFKKCFTVCQAWNDFLTKESFVVKAKSTFGAKMWMDTEHLERRAWKSSKYVYAWTTDGSEIAYMESNDDDDDCEMIHFINIDGNLISREFKIFHKSVQTLWILRHIILIQAEEHIYSVDKITLKKNKLFSSDEVDEGCEVIKFIPMVGVLFLRTNEPDDGQDVFTLTEVSYDHNKDDEWRKNYLDKQECCYSTSAIAPVLKHEDDEGEPIEDMNELRFSEDGSHFMYYCDSEVQVFSIDKDSITHLWDDKEVIVAPRANSQYVVYVTGRSLISKSFIKLRDIKDGGTVKIFEISGDVLDISGHSRYVQIFFANRQIFMFISYSTHNAWSSKTPASLYVVDLDTHKLKLRFSKLVKNHLKAETINGGRVLMFPAKCNNKVTKLHLLDLTAGDPDNVLDEHRLITPRTRLENSYGNKAGGLKKFMEIKKGLCIFEIETELNSMASLLRETDEEEAKFIIEMIAWKGEKMPKAMDSWVEWLEKAD